MQAVIFIGIQASGKSTFYKERFFNTHIRINLDMLKTRNREDILLEACLRAKQPFVVDNTNPTVESRAKYIQAANIANFRIEAYYFESTLQEATLRNMTRTGKAQVPSHAVAITYRRLQPPTHEEGFDAVYRVRLLPSGEFLVDDWNQAST
jgi:predicted kinase